MYGVKSTRRHFTANLYLSQASMFWPLTSSNFFTIFWLYAQCESCLSKSARILHTQHTTTVLRPFVPNYPGEPVSEETLTHPPSWSSSNLISFFHLPRSIASSLFKLCAWQSFCTTSFHVLLGLEPSTSYSIHACKLQYAVRWRHNSKHNVTWLAAANRNFCNIWSLLY